MNKLQNVNESFSRMSIHAIPSHQFYRFPSLKISHGKRKRPFTMAKHICENRFLHCFCGDCVTVVCPKIMCVFFFLILSSIVSDHNELNSFSRIISESFH